MLPSAKTKSWELCLMGSNPSSKSKLRYTFESPAAVVADRSRPPSGGEVEAERAGTARWSTERLGAGEKGMARGAAVTVADGGRALSRCFTVKTSGKTTTD